MKRSIKKTMPLINPVVIGAALEYIGRRDRTKHPIGRSDNGGRWYPDKELEDPKGTIHDTIRSPSRTWPWTYAHACRSAAHVAELYAVDVTLVRRMERELDKPRFLPAIIDRGIFVPKSLT